MLIGDIKMTDEELLNPHKGKFPVAEANRAWASNDKVQYDNLISHCKAMMGYSELAMAQALAFQQKSNDAYLSAIDAREQQRLEHENELEKQAQENNRYTLNYLYGIYPEEAAGLAALLKALREVLKSEETTEETK